MLNKWEKDVQWNISWKNDMKIIFLKYIKAICQVCGRNILPIKYLFWRKNLKTGWWKLPSCIYCILSLHKIMDILYFKFIRNFEHSQKNSQKILIILICNYSNFYSSVLSCSSFFKLFTKIVCFSNYVKLFLNLKYLVI